MWRDYVRQTGAITLHSAAYQCLTGDTRSSDLALWPADGADMAVLQSRTRSAAQQAVAIGIGLFGVAASFSAQVLARRKEFGLLAHLGLTRRQILAVVAGEGAAWTGIGAIAGVPGPGRVGRAGARGQPTELSLDDGDEHPCPALVGAVCGGGGVRDGDCVAGREGGCGEGCGEGGLVRVSEQSRHMRT